MNGQEVPRIVPEIRGMYSWTTKELTKEALGAPLAESATAEEKNNRRKLEVDLRDFLNRVYFEWRNLGVTPQQRAINYAGTNAFQIEKVYKAALSEAMDLDSVEVSRSPFCRPESDCWDVNMFFFFPDRQVQTVRKVYRFTVDVSGVIPVTVGDVQSWFVR